MHQQTTGPCQLSIFQCKRQTQTIVCTTGRPKSGLLRYARSGLAGHSHVELGVLVISKGRIRGSVVRVDVVQLVMRLVDMSLEQPQ
jgi:hypothetical protein